MNADPIEEYPAPEHNDDEKGQGHRQGGPTRRTTEEIKNDEAHLDPSRWWFASSAIPMIAGTLGPVANAFSICALVRPWRQDFPPGTDIDKAPFIDDPIWLTVVNAVQVVMAVVANIVLLLNMAKKIRFAVAQPLTIVAWYVSAICLIVLCATAAGPLKRYPESQYIWSGAFYYGIYAAILYFVCSSLMLLTFYGAMKGHYDKDFQLTNSQRTLMLQTIMYLMYLLIGALVFSTIEDWAYLDAVYWANTTLFTVGFGDYAAQTSLGRALLLPYALVGIISLGLVIGSIRSLVLERGKRQIDARMIEKKRRRTVRRMAKKGKDDILYPVHHDPSNEAHGPPARSQTGLTEFERREKEFDLMRKIQVRAEHRRRWMAMAGSTGTWIILWVVGAAIFQQCELAYQDWSYFDGFYFAFVTLTTVGYGDVTPISPAGKSFFVFWSLLALPTMTVMISNAGDTVVKFVRDATDVLGTITILPGERGFSRDWKEVIKALSFGKLYLDGVHESPPGFLGASSRGHNRDSESDSDSDGDNESENGESLDSGDRMDRKTRQDYEHSVPDSGKKEVSEKPGSATESANSKTADESQNTTPLNPTTIRNTDSKSSTNQNPREQITKSTKEKKKHSSQQNPKGGDGDSPPKELPTSLAGYHVILIDEICRVTQDLRTKPPKKYTFQEWAWFLKLLGEDEGSSVSHRKPNIAPGRKLFGGRSGTSGKGKSESVKPAAAAYSDQKLVDVEKSSQDDKSPSSSMSPQLDASQSEAHGRGANDSSQVVETTTSLPKDGEDGSGTGGTGDTGGTGAGTGKSQWSWVGTRSPLMGSQEESEWILEKLQARLADSLKAQRDAP